MTLRPEQIESQTSTPSLPDIHGKLLAEAYPTITQTTKIDYPQCHSNPHSGDATPPLIINPNSADANASSSSNSRATVGDTSARSNSNASVGDTSAASSATGGNARVGDTSAAARGGDVNINNQEKVQAPNVFAPTVVPGAPAATSYEYNTGRRDIRESSNATTDTTSFGASVGTGAIGVGITFGSSRPAETEVVQRTQRNANAAFDLFVADTVSDADRNLAAGANALRRGVVNSRLQQQREASEEKK